MLFFALPLSISAYVAFGRGLLDPRVLDGTVVDALRIFGPSTFEPALLAVRAVIVLHLLTALPIILTPVLLRLERGILGDPMSGV